MNSRNFFAEFKRRDGYTHGLRRRIHYSFRFADTLGMGSASDRSAVSKNPGRSGAEDNPLKTYSIVSRLRCMLERRFDLVSCCDLALPAVMQRRTRDRPFTWLERSRNAFRCNALTIQRFSAPLGQCQMACSRMERAGKPRHRSQNPRGEGESAGSDRIKSFGVET